MKCPTCQGELAPDSSNSGKVLCYICKKRFDEAEVRDYWEAQAASRQPADLPGPDPQPYGKAPVQAGYAPYGAGAIPQAPAAQPAQPYASAAGGDASRQYGAVPAQVPPGQPPYGYQPKPGKGLAIASLVLGILALPLSWVPIVGLFCAVMGIVAIVLGIIGIKKASAGTASGKGLAITGLALGALSVFLAVAMTIFTGPIMFKMLGDPQFMEMVREVANGNVNQEELDQWTTDYAHDLVNNTNTAKKPGADTGNATAPPSNAPAPSNAVNDASALPGTTASALRPDQVEVTIEGAEVRNDAFGKPALVITYNVKNKSDGRISFNGDIFDNVSQPGGDRLAYAVIEEGSGFIDDDAAEYIAPGSSRTVHECYELVQTGGSVQVRLEVMSDAYTDAILEQEIALP